MRYATLRFATLVGVNFSGARRYWVDVSGAYMNNIDLGGAQVLDTPISVGGEDLLEEGVLEPMIPFENANPDNPYESLIGPEP